MMWIYITGLQPCNKWKIPKYSLVWKVGYLYVFNARRHVNWSYGINYRYMWGTTSFLCFRNSPTPIMMFRFRLDIACTPSINLNLFGESLICFLACISMWSFCSVILLAYLAENQKVIIFDNMSKGSDHLI